MNRPRLLIYFKKERRTKEMKAAIEAERQAKERALAQGIRGTFKGT